MGHSVVGPGSRGTEAAALAATAAAAAAAAALVDSRTCIFSLLHTAATFAFSQKWAASEARYQTFQKQSGHLQRMQRG